ncbi:DUF3298 and DUF4163 domain-containing protein [Clostridium sp. LP20]|uniref:DUF3298 and DUF4163 domain-containing protein n=1 Tax=Clostridium sp. LP20 TaxID=3418665 RepID=UPI003EE536F6
MRLGKIALITLLITNLFNLSYPHGMLISNKSKNEEEVKIVDKIISKKDEILKVDVIIPEVKGLVDKKKEKELNDRIMKWTNDWIKDIRSIADENFLPGSKPSFPYEAVSRYIVSNNDKDVLSMYIDYYQFTGGAHGITTRIPYTVEVKSGNILSLKDLFNESYNYKAIIDKEVRRQIALDKDKYFDGGEIFKGIKDNQSFYIEGDNIVIFFGQYEIAPYVAGIVEFRIPVTLFKNSYRYGKIVDK